MQDTATIEQEPTTAKTPATRLMDMLCGWSDFVSTDEEIGVSDSRISTEEIGALYQEAGTLVGTEEEAAKVHHFLISRVLPLLLRE